VKKKMDAIKKMRNGFSVLEILITTAVIGVIVGIATVGYTAVRKNVEEKSVEQLSRQIQMVLKDMYLEQNPNEYPPGITTTNLTNWIAPTNLSNIQQLQEYYTQLPSNWRLDYYRTSSNDFELCVNRVAPSPFERVFILTSNKFINCSLNNFWDMPLDMTVYSYHCFGQIGSAIPGDPKNVAVTITIDPSNSKVIDLRSPAG